MSVTELRTLLRVNPMPPTASFVDRLSFAAWAIIAGVVIVAPVLVLFAGLRGVVRLLGR